MPKSSNPINVAVSALLAVMAVPIMILGIVGLFSGGEIWWLFGLLAASGGLMIVGAIQGVLRWKKAVAEEEATTRAMLQAVGASPAYETSPAASPAASHGRLPEPVLAHWRYDPAEWSAYANREAAYRGREAFRLGLGVTALGTVLLGFSEGDWAGGLAVSAVIGGIIGVGRWAMARSARASNLSVPAGEVIIAPNAILLNGRYEVLQDHHFRFGGVRYVETERPPILEFTVTWPTRGGRTNEQYRVPVPTGREDEARALVDTFRRIHAEVLAG